MIYFKRIIRKSYKLICLSDHNYQAKKAECTGEKTEENPAF